jgi:hypothetical protein
MFFSKLRKSNVRSVQNRHTGTPRGQTGGGGRGGEGRTHRASVADGSVREGGGEAAAPAVGVGPGVAHGPVDDGCPVRLRQRGALEEPERRERRVVGGVPRQVVDVPVPRHLGHQQCSSSPLREYELVRCGGFDLARSWGLLE